MASPLATEHTLVREDLEGLRVIQSNHKADPSLQGQLFTYIDEELLLHLQIFISSHSLRARGVGGHSVGGRF